MAIRYTPEELKHLRESPLVVKPTGLPPAEQWMGAAAEGGRTQTNRQPTDRIKNHDPSILLDQSSRRPAHISRNSTNPEDIVLGPPKTSFMSATSIRSSGKSFDAGDRPGIRNTDSRDRYNFRDKLGEGDNERTRDGRSNNLRPKRTEGDSDGEGWSMVKPRKSFGTEGAERFNGRMGGDRHRDDKRDDRRFKDREDRDMKDRPPRGFENLSRDKDRDRDRDHDHQENEGRRNGNGRGRNEPSWFKDDGPPTQRDHRNSNGDRLVDRSRGWREKDRDDRGPDRGGDRDRDRGHDRGDRRWDRDREQKQERDPEWMDEPAEEKTQAHTQEDFQKWKEQMSGKDTAKATPAEETRPIPDALAQGGFFGVEKSKVETPLTPLPMDTGPDKFFGMWAGKDATGPDSAVESKNEGTAKAKTVGKTSRFATLFTPQEEPQRRQTEPPPPVATGPPSALESMLSPSNGQSPQEKEAFQILLQKLNAGKKNPATSGSTPPVNPSQQPNPPPQERQSSLPMPSQESFQQYRQDRQDDSRLQDLLRQRQMTGSQPSIKPEQMLQELVGQRQNALSQSSIRPDQPQSRNSNTEFLMGLMQSAKAAPEPQRTEQLLLRMPPQKQQLDRQMQHQLMMEREQELHREVQRERNANASQRRAPPGFYDDRAPQQPMQILQRPPPPGLAEPSWAQQPAQLPPRHVAPPPGLPGRGMPMPQQMFPPGFPMGNFPPEVMVGGPPGNMRAPPGFFPNGPPPGFMPQGMSGFPGPDGMAFGGPYDGRGPPPQGAFRRQ